VSLSLSLSRLSPLEAFGPVPNSYQSDPSPASEIRGGLTSIRQNDPIRVGVPLTSLDLGRGADLFLFALRPMPGTFQGLAVGATEFLCVVP